MVLTANDEVNYLFIQKVKEEVKEIELYAALQPPAETLNARMFHQQGAELLFGRTVDVELWNRRFADKQVRLQFWQCAAQPAADGSRGWSPYSEATGGLLAAATAEQRVFPCDRTPEKDDWSAFCARSGMGRCRLLRAGAAGCWTAG